MNKLLTVVALLASTAQAQTNPAIEVYGVTVNGVSYADNMVVPAAGKDSSGNYTLTVKFGLRGAGAWGTGAQVFALSDQICQGAYLATKNSDGSPQITMGTNCTQLFSWEFFPFSGGAGSIKLNAPGSDGLYTATYSVPLATAGQTLKLSHQFANMTNNSTVTGTASAVGAISAGCTYVAATTAAPVATCPTTGKTNVFTLAGFGAAISGLVADYTTTTTGTLKSRVVSSKIRVNQTSFDQIGNLYVAAYFPTTGQLFFQSGGGWVLWDGVNFPAYRENVTLGNNDLGTIVSGYNLRSLVGAKLYVGFGKSGAELVAKSQFSMIHELVMTQADRDEIAAEEAVVAAEIAAQKAKFDACVVAGCEVKFYATSTSVIKVTDSQSMLLGLFGWTGSQVTWTVTNATPVLSLGRIFSYDTITGYWK